MFRLILSVTILVSLVACQDARTKSEQLTTELTKVVSKPFIQVLGIAQDAGYPQIGCTKSCCKDLWDDPIARKMVSCIALVDPQAGDYWMFDATPDIKDQIAICNNSLQRRGGLLLIKCQVRCF